MEKVKKNPGKKKLLTLLGWIGVNQCIDEPTGQRHLCINPKVSFGQIISK